jgi:hypothetical protein
VGAFVSEPLWGSVLEVGVVVVVSEGFGCEPLVDSVPEPDDSGVEAGAGIFGGLPVVGNREPLPELPP